MIGSWAEDGEAKIWVWQRIMSICLIAAWEKQSKIPLEGLLVRGMLGVEGAEADLWWPWESWGCFLSDIQNSWVGTLPESVPGGSAVWKSAKSFHCPAGCYIAASYINKTLYRKIKPLVPP